MAFTRAVPPRTQTHTGVSAPSDDVGVKCDGHGRRAKQFQAGPSAKNPGRWFFACPLSRDDPKRCKFFKWADEVPGARGVGSSPAAGGMGGGGGGRTLGASPAHAPPGVRSPFAPTATSLTRAVNSGPPAATTPLTTPSKIAPTLDKFFSGGGAGTKEAPASGNVESIEVFSDDDEGSSGEIDWGSVDADALEREAERLSATPVSARRTAPPPAPVSPTGGSGARVQERLAAAAAETPSASTKRKRDDNDEEDTPRKANPFLATPSTTSTSLSPGARDGAAHPALGPTITALEGLGEHLARQERLVRAAESMKRAMRSTIKNLQEEVRTLQARVAELEGRKDKNA